MSQGSSVTVDALRSMPIFESLSVERLMPIARVAVFRKMPRSSTILRAGDRTDFVYFILSGALKVLVSDEEGREVILSNLGPGEFFGEMGVLDDNPRSATVMGLLEEARSARARGLKAAAQAGSVKTIVGRAKDWFLGNF